MAPIPLLALALWCAALSACDLRARRLPDALTLPGAVVVLAYGFAAGAALPALFGAALLTLPYLAVHLAHPAALGAGDVKLAVGLGAATALG
ncbi:prepilin peptidase, partial [Nocardia sp. NPDC004722]